jgi:hypothetical protein
MVGAANRWSANGRANPRREPAQTGLTDYLGRVNFDA